jgi:hypothetical protein
MFGSSRLQLDVNQGGTLPALKMVISASVAHSSGDRSIANHLYLCKKA